MDGLNPELMRGSLELMVLSVLSDGSKYGYLIQQPEIRMNEQSRIAQEMSAPLRELLTV